MKTIIHAFDIDGDCDAVREAVTTLDGLRGWWSTVADGGLEVGEVIDFTFGGDFNPDMLIEEKNAAVAWRCVGGHEPWRENVFRFEFTGRRPTRVVFHQEYARELSDVDYGIYNFNWGYYLESLRLYVETGVGKPFEAR